MSRRVGVALLALLCMAENAAAAEPPLNLGVLDAVRYALARNPDVLLLEKQVEISRGAAQQASGQFDSTLRAGIAQSIDNTPLNRQNAEAWAAKGLGNQNRADVTNYSVALDTPLRNGMVLSQSLAVTRNAGNLNDYSGIPVQNGSAVRFSVNLPLAKGRGEAATFTEKAAVLEWEASRLDLRHAIGQSVYVAASAYWAVLAARKTLEIAVEVEDGLARLVADTRRLIEADEIPAADIHLVRANLLEKNAARVAAEQALLDARQRLGQVLGLSFQDIYRLEPADGFPELAPPADDPAIRRGALLGLAMQRRADLRAAHLRLDQARMLSAAAQDALKPQLDLNVGVGYNGLAEGGGAGALSDAVTRNLAGSSFSTRLSYQWPFDNNAARGRYLQQAAAYDQGLIRAQNVERAIGVGVESALAGLTRSAIQMQQAGETVALYQIAVDNEKTKHKLGNSTLIDVLNVNDRLLAARLARVGYLFNYFSAMARLRFETGTLLEDEGDGYRVTLAHLSTPPNQD